MSTVGGLGSISAYWMGGSAALTSLNDTFKSLPQFLHIRTQYMKQYHMHTHTQGRIVTYSVAGMLANKLLLEKFLRALVVTARDSSAQGIKRLVTGTTQLVPGIKRLVTGTKSLRLVMGIKRLVTGTTKLVPGINYP